MEAPRFGAEPEPRQREIFGIPYRAIPNDSSPDELVTAVQKLIIPDYAIGIGTRSSDVRFHPTYLPDDRERRFPLLEQIATTGTTRRQTRGITRVLRPDTTSDTFYCLTPHHLLAQIDRRVVSGSRLPHWNTVLVYQADALREVRPNYAHFKNPRQGSQSLLGIVSMEPRKE